MTAQDDQYIAAIREAEQTVRSDEFGFLLNEPGRPEVLARLGVPLPDGAATAAAVPTPR